MSETDSLVEGSGNDTALSVTDGAAAIESLLSDVPETDSVESEESQHEGQDSQQDVSQDADDAGDDGLEFDDETEAQETDAPEEPKFKAGQFAADDAKVTLSDGTTISVAELKSGFMFQRVFTEKTTALSGEKKAFETERNQFAETKNQIEQQRNVILTLANELMPKEPPRPDDPNDPVAYLEYRIAKDAYDEKMGKLQYLWNSTQENQRQQQQQVTGQQVQEFKNALQTEQQKLVTAIPELKDPERRKKFRNEAVVVGAKAYNLTEAEIDGLVDHRFVLVLRDAIAYRQAREKFLAKKNAVAPPANQIVQQPRIQQRQRMAQTPQARDQVNADDRLRKTGSINDAAKALMQFV